MLQLWMLLVDILGAALVVAVMMIAILLLVVAAVELQQLMLSCFLELMYSSIHYVMKHLMMHGMIYLMNESMKLVRLKRMKSFAERRGDWIHSNFSIFVVNVRLKENVNDRVGYDD